MLKKLLLVMCFFCMAGVLNGQIEVKEPKPPRQFSQKQNEAPKYVWSFLSEKELICDRDKTDGYTVCREDNYYNADGFGNCSNRCPYMLSLTTVDFSRKEVGLVFYKTESGSVIGRQTRKVGGWWDFEVDEVGIRIIVDSISGNKVLIKSYLGSKIQPVTDTPCTESPQKRIIEKQERPERITKYMNS